MNFKEKEKRLKDILFIMEYWEELPERLQGKFEGMVTILADFMQEKKKCINQLDITNENLSTTSNKVSKCCNTAIKNNSKYLNDATQNIQIKEERKICSK